MWLHDYTWPILASKLRNDCERCGEDAFAADDHKLCGCVTARLCKLCLRKWETDATVRKLTEQKSLANVRLNAFIHGGSAGAAEGEHFEYMKAENALFERAMEWLREGNERERPAEPSDGKKNGVHK